MNRKQAIIIVTLFVLIVCAGVLAAKVNSPLYTSDTNFADNSTNSAAADTSSNIKNTAKSDNFAETRLTRDKSSAETIQTLKSIIDDKNAPQESRENATKQSISIATSKENTTTIENMLKNKGYKDALCTILNDRVNIVVKCDADKLSDKQQREIKDVVLSVTKIRNIEISPPVH